MALLILGGTAEARELALALQHVPGARVSLAGATRHPRRLALPVRQGGFGGADGFAAYLRCEGITGVLDATHPFAAQITARSRAVCDELGIAYRQLLRPAWASGAGDCWHHVADAASAVDILPGQARVFLATGRQSVDGFSGLGARAVFVRVIDPPEMPFPFASGGYVTGLPPADISEEIALFKRLGVTWLVTKNSGGAQGQAKLHAARQIGIPVAMIARPPGATDRLFARVSDARDWALGDAPI